MGATSQNLPYPEVTDPVSAGANAIKLLAQAVDAIAVHSIPGELRMGRIAMTGGGSSSMVAAFTYTADPIPAGAVVYAFAQVVSGSGASKAVVTVAPGVGGLSQTTLVVTAYLTDGSAFIANPNLIVNVFFMLIRQVGGPQMITT